MPKFVIERNAPGTGKMTADQHREIARTSCNVLRAMGPDIQWVHSYFTDDKIYCLYIAPNADLVREHARRADIPADVISTVRAVLDPTTAE